MFLWTLDARPEEVNGDPELLGSNGSLFRNEREPLTVGLCLQGHAAQPGQPKGPTGQLGELCPHAPTSYFPNPGPVFLLVTRKNWGSVYEREIAAFVPETLLGKGEKEQEEVLFSKTWGRRMLVAGVGVGLFRLQHLNPEVELLGFDFLAHEILEKNLNFYTSVSSCVK